MMPLAVDGSVGTWRTTVSTILVAGTIMQITDIRRDRASGREVLVVRSFDETRDWWRTPRPVEKKNWLTVYRVTRDFGGHEEGGWYYDYYEPLESVRCSNSRHVARFRAILERKYGHLQSDYPRHSVLSDGDIQILHENMWQESATTVIPHYE